MSAIPTADEVYIELQSSDLELENAADRIIEVTEATAELIRQAIQRVAVSLKPDLVAIGASKATVKIGAKLAIKNGRLTALISEISGEGTVEVTVEFTP